MTSAGPIADLQRYGPLQTLREPVSLPVARAYCFRLMRRHFPEFYAFPADGAGAFSSASELIFSLFGVGGRISVSSSEIHGVGWPYWIGGTGCFKNVTWAR